MNRIEYLKKLDELKLDKNRYCIISGGIMLLYGLREETEDIDIRIRPDYFEELKQRFKFKKSSKIDNLYELSNEIEVRVLDYDDSNIEMYDGYPVWKLELQLEWFKEHNRDKDKKKIKIIEEYLKNKVK